jgi:uncharacterized protein YhbP (UPF0306 family)
MRPVSRLRIERVAFELLDASPLCSISTVSPRAAAHVNTAYFAWNHEFDIVWLSDPAARHSCNIGARPSTAIAVYHSDQIWGESDRGIQLFGLTQRLAATESAAAAALYEARFPGYAGHDLRAYPFFRFRTHRMRVFDETAFDPGALVTAVIDNLRRPVWERTDIATGANRAD